jgi:OmpA-OmpF porin, OOP family
MRLRLECQLLYKKLQHNSLGKIMKKNILIALVAAAVLAPVAAQAQSYIGANAGRGEQKINVDDFGSNKDNDTAFKIYGGYQFTPVFGIEAGYADLGKVEVSAAGDTIGARPKSIYLAATGTLALNDRFALFGKVGAAWSRATITATGEADSKEKNASALLGVGASFAITPSVLAVLEYENFGKVIDEDAGNSKANVWSAGIRVKF